MPVIVRDHHSQPVTTVLVQTASFLVCSSARVDQQDHQSYVAEAEGSCAQQTADTESDEDSCATAQSSESSTTAESKTEHAEDTQQLQLQNHHAQLPQQVQEHEQAQHAQHTQQPQPAQQGQKVGAHTPHQQSSSEMGATRCRAQGAESYVAASTHSKQSCQSSLTLFKFGKKKSSSCSPAAGRQGAACPGEAGKAAAAATAGGGNPPRDPSQSSGRQVLKSLVRKVTPSCMMAPNTCTDSQQQQQEQQQQQQQQQQVFSGRGLSNPSMHDMVTHGSRKVQLGAAHMNASTVTSKQQPLPGAVDSNQPFSKLRGIFRRKQPLAHVRRLAGSECVKDCGIESGEPAAGDLIAAMQGPAGAAPQAEISGHITTKSADQVRST